MLVKIAWRNIWRSRGRSLVVLGSIVVGIWALVSAVGFMNGFIVGYMADIINHDISSIQIHNPEFKKDKEVKYVIVDGEQKVQTIEGWAGVKAATSRVLVNGMIASPKKASGVQIRGIDPAEESQVTQLDSLIGEGTYFEGIKRNPILIGKKLAEKLGVGVKSKVVLTFTDANLNLTSAAFRIAGIIESSSINLNEGYAFVKQSDLIRLLGIQDVHEIAVLTDPQIDEATIVAKYKESYPSDLPETWREIAPELALIQEMYSSMLYVLITIVMIALVFGILNTMLMAVLERFKELGMLMAVGMARIKVFGMVLLETIFIGVLGAPIGLLFGWLTMLYYTSHGIDLSAYSEGLESFGYSSILYPYIEDSTYMTIAIAVVITAFVGAVYPAWKAIRLKPVEALHKI
ncbi:MAG: ABC transporter permease [Flammeovirgaceae bacterium]|nr:ABC transporter permease [Flammeovirgaceae bacterium]HCX25124.1 ABC transporter permease [Cytophagales bacterium]|tara:strand:- start:444 stop:1655 length:1212 start_codon:yes stop_codon:yes gene_type:complete